MNKNSWVYQSYTTVLLIGILLVIVIHGLATGRATVVYTSYKKSEDPIYYWVGIGIPVIFLVGLIYSFFFE